MGLADNVAILRDRKVESGANDPLLSAVVDKLPPAGAAWPAGDRQAWLTMMSNAFDVVYGAATGGSMSAASSRPAPVARKPAKKKPAKAQRRPAPPRPLGPTGPAFFIDRQGIARRAGGDRIMPDDVMDHIVDLRGEHGDLATITWADDSRGIPRGKQLDITLG